MKWYRGLCTDLLVFALQLRKLRKASARRPSMKAVRQAIAPNGVPYLQMRSVGSHVRKEKEEIKEMLKFLLRTYTYCMYVILQCTFIYVVGYLNRFRSSPCSMSLLRRVWIHKLILLAIGFYFLKRAKVCAVCKFLKMFYVFAHYFTFV